MNRSNLAHDMSGEQNTAPQDTTTGVAHLYVSPQVFSGSSSCQAVRYVSSGSEQQPCANQWEVKHWRTVKIPRGTQPFTGYVVTFQSDESLVGKPGDAVITEDPWPVLWGRCGVGDAPKRGVVAIRHRHKILFTKTLSLVAGNLPRLKPRATLSPRVLSDRSD